MPVPVVNAASSILSFNQWVYWEFQISASNTAYDYRIDTGSVPVGMSFQPSYNVTISATGDTVNLMAHGLTNGACLVARTLAGGTGLSTGTLYFVVNAAPNTFQLAATPGGTPINITVDYTAAQLYRPGVLAGAATVPGVSNFVVFASNGTGESAAGVNFSVGIKPAAAALDTNANLVWDFATNAIIAQTSSALNLTPAPRDTPIIFVKQQDDLIIRLRTTNGSSVLDLGAIADGDCKLVLKQNETDGKIIISDNSRKISSGDANSILIHAKIDSAALKGAFGDYENDAGTFFGALAEIELTYPNPGYFDTTPASLVRTSPTFRIQTERDLGES